MQDHKISTLIPFDLLYDTDFGVVKFLQITTNKSDDIYKMLYPGILEMYDVKDNLLLQYILSKRDIVNPLSCIFKDEYLSQLNQIYDGIMDTHFNEVLKYSCETSLINMMFTSINLYGDTMKFTVLCKNDSEAEKIIERAKKDNFAISTVSPDKIDYTKYDTLYRKNVYDLDDLIEKDIRGKNIIIVNHDFNMNLELGIPKPELLDKLVIENKIHTCNLYDFKSLQING